MAESSFLKEVRMDDVQNALDVLSQYGEVWFFPGNNGDLGNLMVGDEVVACVRTYIERHDG